jgi:hypothetical protein
MQLLLFFNYKVALNTHAISVSLDKVRSNGFIEVYNISK